MMYVAPYSSISTIILLLREGRALLCWGSGEGLFWLEGDILLLGRPGRLVGVELHERRRSRLGLRPPHPATRGEPVELLLSLIHI